MYRSDENSNCRPMQISWHNNFYKQYYTDVDLKRQMRKLYANVNSLLGKFSKCSVDVNCFIFKTYSSNLYCAPMWFDCIPSSTKKVKNCIQQQPATIYVLVMA